MKTRLSAKTIWRESALKSHAFIQEEKKRHELSMSILKIGAFFIFAIGVFMQGGV